MAAFCRRVNSWRSSHFPPLRFSAASLAISEAVWEFQSQWGLNAGAVASMKILIPFNDLARKLNQRWIPVGKTPLHIFSTNPLWSDENKVLQCDTSNMNTQESIVGFGSVFTIEQERQLADLKAHFPFRIVWGALSPDNSEFEAHADYDRRKLMRYVRKGWACSEVIKGRDQNEHN